MQAQSKFRFLVVDDEPYVIEAIRELLSAETHIEVHGCESGPAAIELLRQSPYRFAVILMDFKLPNMSGAEATREILKINPHQIVAMHSGDLSQESAVTSWRAGAVDFIYKADIDAKNKILQSLQKYIENGEVFEDEATSSENRAKIEAIGIAGASPEMAQVANVVRVAAKSNASVVITGESGVGKEEIAKAVHRLSARSNRKFIAENMTAIPTELFESTFFGHVKGSFTGATHDKPGHFKVADGGTLFFDEIGDLSLGHQAKLLRVLETGEFYPVGSNKLERVNVRIVAATNVNLEASVADKRFREDLYYRLNVIRIQVPALRDRIEDVRPLVEHFRKRNKTRQVVLTELIRKFEKYSWPGNVRELNAELMRLFEVFKDEPRLTAKHLDPKFFAVSAPSPKQKELMTFEEFDNLTKRELVLLIRAHQRRHTNLRDLASEGLKIPYSTLFSKMKALGLIEIKESQENEQVTKPETKEGNSMRKQTKVVAAAVVAATSANAFAGTVSVTAGEMASYEQERALPGLTQRLLNVGILVPSGSQNVYVLNDTDIGGKFDDQTILLVSDLVFWISSGKVHQKKIGVYEMEASAQDYDSK